MSFLETLDGPHTRIVNGKSYAFPQLTTRDYLPWLTQLAAERRKAFLDLLPAGRAQTPTQIQERQKIALYDVTPDNLVPLIGTGDGTIRVLEMVARKNGMEEEAVIAWVDAGTPKQNTYDAYRFSGLVPAEWIASVYPPPMPNRYIELIDAASSGDSKTVQILASAIASEMKAAADDAKRAKAEQEKQENQPDPNVVAA